MLKIVNLKTEYKTNPVGIGTRIPRLSWQLVSDQKLVTQNAYRILTARSPDDLRNKENLTWDSGRRESDESIHVEYAGLELMSAQRMYWTVQAWDSQGDEAVAEEETFWETGFFNMSDWESTEWITIPWKDDPQRSAPCPWFRKSFTLSRPVRSARIYASALGLYELELNGSKVGDEVFAPGWTNYHKQIQYQVYEVTDLLRMGDNTLGAVIGDGWYRGHIGWWEDNRNTYGATPALILQLRVDYEGGYSEIIGSDDSWKVTTGPILNSDIYNGETYDARLELKGWSEASFDDSKWFSAKELDHPKDILISSEGEKIRKVMEIKPVTFFTTPAGEKVFDLGQNMVGWTRLNVRGKKGETVKLQFAEALDQEGNFYTENLRNISCTDTYTLGGRKAEVYEPRFTFHGFRYVKIEGYPGELSLDSITGIVVHSDMDLTGYFECSDSMINQLQSNIQWGQRGNFLDIPTDCPQRDERLGWTGDAQVFAPTASFNFNTASFFTKWLKGLQSEQRQDGSVPWVVPNIIVDGGGTGWSDGFGATGWADAAVIVPWVLYQAYGDKRILAIQYDSMKGWVEYMINHSPDLIFDHGFHFGDWLSLAEYHSYNYNAPDYGYAGAHTEKSLISTAYFYYSTDILAKVTGILSKKEDALKYGALLPKIKHAWNKEFVTETGRLVSNTQTAFALALKFGLIAEDKREIVAQKLAKDVSYFGHLTTGFLGTPVLNYALSDFGHPDLAYTLLHNDRYPSWLYPITRGATTIWERWDGIKPDGSFQTAGMNSFNHYAYGAIGEWLYSRVAGIRIDPQQPGYKRTIFYPLIGGQLTFAKAKIMSMYGMISASWKKENGMVTYRIMIPPNTGGIVKIDTIGPVNICGDPIKSCKQVSNLEIVEDQTQFELGSGNYQITWKT